MSRVVVVLLFVAALFHADTTFAQGNADAGKAMWNGQQMWCRNCHGEKGEGAFGPDLAARKLSFDQFKHAVRQPWGVMPAFTPEWISDQDLQNLMAFLDTQPAVTEPGKLRVAEPPAGSPLGLQLLVTGYGCAQCHGANMGGTRQDMGSGISDFEWFKRQVYTHTTEMPAYRKVLGEDNSILRMGNFSAARLPEATLREMWNYTVSLGARAYITSRMTSKPAANGTEYTLVVDNGGLPGKGLVAEDATITISLAPGVTVANPSQQGYQGVKADAGLKADAVVWRTAKIAPHESQTFTFTVSGGAAGTAPVGRGEVRWAKPLSEAKPDFIAIGAPAPAGAGRGGRGGGAQ